MSPKQTKTDQSFPPSQTYSPWIDAYQTNPVHLTGTYTTHDGRRAITAHDDESLLPTHEALSHIYDLEERDN